MNSKCSIHLSPADQALRCRVILLADRRAQETDDTPEDSGALETPGILDGMASEGREVLF